MAVFSVPVEPAHGRGDAGGPRHLGDARDDPAMGPQIRPGIRQPHPSASASPWRQLLPQDLPWRQHELAYREAFPQDQILVVVQGPTTELVEMAADRLAAELRTRDGRFPSVR